MKKNRSNKKRSAFLLSVFIAAFPALVLSIKNIVNLGFDDFVENIPIYVILFLLLTLTIFTATYVSEKIEAKKPKSNGEQH